MTGPPSGCDPLSCQARRLAESNNDVDPADHAGAATSRLDVVPPPSRALTPVEMAQAAVMAALSAALAIISVVVPFAGGLSLLVTVPMGLLGYRYRLRVLLAATFAASTVAFLIGGISGFMVVLNCAYVGGVTGIIKRRGGGAITVIAVSVVAGLLNGLLIVGAADVAGPPSHPDLRGDDRQRRRSGDRAVTVRTVPAVRSGHPRPVRHSAGVLAGADHGLLDVHHHGGVGGGVVGAVAGARPAARHPRRAQARDPRRERHRGAASAAARRCPLPLSGRRPRRTAAAEPVHRRRRAHRRHRRQRIGQDHADAAAVGPRTHLGQHRAPRGGRTGPAGRHRGRPAAPGEPGARHPGRR